jgi:hypothetical protein
MGSWGSNEVSLGPAIPYHPTPCRRGGQPPAGLTVTRVLATHRANVLLQSLDPSWTPHEIRPSPFAEPEYAKIGEEVEYSKLNADGGEDEYAEGEAHDQADHNDK